ncbi:MAG: 30S ribosomal protein S6 [Acidimicrobiia bacterium]|nr:30S ribosomal protein S6 [Acidimicrobiia bacterium]
MRTYELMTIFRPQMAETEVRNEVATIEQALALGGAEVKATDFWGKRRFAYEIEHLSEGYYALVTFEAEAGAVDDVDRALSLSDNVLRHKFIRPE